MAGNLRSLTGTAVGLADLAVALGKHAAYRVRPPARRRRGPLRIGLDGAPMQSSTPTGMERYATLLFRALQEVDPDSAYTLLLDGSRPAPAGIGRARVRRLRFPVTLFERLAGRPKIEIATGPIDVFHCQPGFTPPFDYGALVVTLHDVIPLLMPPEVFGKERCDEYRAHLTALARAATLLICGSRAAADTVAPTLGFPRERVRIVPYAPDPRFSRAPAPEERAALRAHLNLPGPYVLALGTRSPHKNHVRLIRGFAAIAPEVPHHLVIAGGWGLSAEEIGRTIEETGLGERVRIVEYAPDEHLPALFAEADLFVQPSLHEGFGLPLADAMLAGVPVACSASSCMPEVAGEAARYFDPLDCTSIADALSAVLRHPERRAELSTASRTQAAIFSWEKTARMTLAVYEEASGGVKSEK